MKIGVISNSVGCIPLLAFLAQKTDVCFYLGRSTEHDTAGLNAFCNANGIGLFSETPKEHLYQWAEMNQPDLIFISGYNKLIETERLESVPGGVFNIHYGALPFYRGPSPVFWALKNGEPSLTLTIHRLSARFDSGDVVWELTVPNQEHCTFNFVSGLFNNLQVNGVQEIVYKYINLIPLSERRQEPGDARYYNKPALNDVLIDWDVLSARQVINLVKACNGWNNGATSLINSVELKITDAEILDINPFPVTPGMIHIDDSRLLVNCADGKLLKVNTFYLNNNYIPARHAGFYGLSTGQSFAGSKIFNGHLHVERV